MSREVIRLIIFATIFVVLGGCATPRNPMGPFPDITPKTNFKVIASPKYINFNIQDNRPERFTFKDFKNGKFPYDLKEDPRAIIRKSLKEGLEKINVYEDNLSKDILFVDINKFESINSNRTVGFRASVELGMRLFSDGESKYENTYDFTVEEDGSLFNLLNDFSIKLGKSLEEVMTQVFSDESFYLALSRIEGLPSLNVNGTTIAAKSAPVTVKTKWNLPEAKQERVDAIAVIIGNRNYSTSLKGVPDVTFALNDAEVMRSYVTKTLGYRNGNIIYMKDATQSEFIGTFGTKENPLGKLHDWVRPGESDVFVYYSGHGAPSLKTGKGYLLPVDADPERVDLTGYPLETLYANLAKIPARSVTVILDACFSGSSNNGSVVKNASSISLRTVKPTNSLPNATILTAADASEVASWDEPAGHGLFTRYFLEGVTGAADKERFGNGDGVVTLGELKKYLASEVTYQARREYGRDQHPQVSGATEKILGMVN